MFASCQFTFCSCFIRCRVSGNKSRIKAVAYRSMFVVRLRHIFNATVDFATVWPTSKFVIECLTMLIFHHTRLSFDFVPTFWCDLELKKTLLQTYIVAIKATFGKPLQTNVNKIHAQLTRTKKMAFHEKYHVWWIIAKTAKLVLYFVKNIGCNQRGGERIS